MPYARVDGCELFYADDDFADPWRPHDTVFLQHNVTGDHTQFRPWVPYLAGEFRVIRMDRRGNGLSGKPPFGFAFTLDGLVADFVGFLDALCIDAVHYVGASLGGVLGVALAVRHPERVRSLTLVSTPCFIRDVTSKTFTRPGYPDAASAVMAMGSWLYAHTGWAWTIDGGKQDSDEERMRRLYNADRVALAPPHVIASLQRMVTAPGFTIEPFLGQVAAPTLLLSPEKSPHTPPEEQAMMASVIPRCHQVLFEGAGHAIASDHVERAASETLRFVRAHSSRPAAPPASP